MIRLALLLAALVVGAAGAVAQTATAALILSDGTTTRGFTAKDLLARQDGRMLSIADPVYGKPMTYRAVPTANLLRLLKVAPDDYVQARATDDFSIAIPARLLLATSNAAPQAFIAIDDPIWPWPPLPGRADKTSAGPFYIVWLLPAGQTVSSEYWAYHLASLSVTESPVRRWPQLAVGAEVPADDPIRRGLDRYVELCIACHRFKGAGEGEQGPDLGQPMNPVQYFQEPALKQLVRNPASVRRWPEMKMPGFDRDRLSDADLDAVVAWLAYKARQN